MVDTPFRTSPNLGPDLTQVVKADEVFYDGSSQLGTPQLGVTCEGTDGRTRMWVEASDTIASASSSGTQVAITVTAHDDVTAATGSGGWYSVPGVAMAAGDRFWATKGTAP